MAPADREQRHAMSEPPPITDHGRARARERAGLRGAALDRLLPRVRAAGLGLDSTTGKLHRYLVWLSSRVPRSPSAPVIYGGQVYVFSAGDGVLITVLPLPHEHRKAAIDCQRKRRRRP